MFVGRSDEERELSREESPAGMGWSFNPLAALSTVKNIFTSPTTRTLAASGALGPQAALVVRADMLAKGVKAASKGPPKAAPKAASPVEEVSSLPSKAATASVGAWQTHDDNQILRFINREPDPEKRQRMVMNHERAKRMRSVTAGSGVSEVEEAIGELYARVPIDAARRPYLDAKSVKDISFHMASKWGGGRPRPTGVARARKLIAAYTRMNKISTPGLKVVRA